MKRIKILSGHYGSGKSEVAVNLAINEKVDMLVDLDIVNPYFRVRSVRTLLENHGIDLIESTIENMAGSDLPYVSPKANQPFVSPNKTAIYDLAGTKSGAKIMMQYHEFIDLDFIEFLIVVNIYRMETSSKDKILTLIEELEGSSQLKVTGLINNSNLMDETNESHIEAGEKVLKRVSETLNIPITHTFIEENVKTKRQFAGQNVTLKRYLAEHWL